MHLCVGMGPSAQLPTSYLFVSDFRRIILMTEKRKTDYRQLQTILPTVLRLFLEWELEKVEVKIRPVQKISPKVISRFHLFLCRSSSDACPMLKAGYWQITPKNRPRTSELDRLGFEGQKQAHVQHLYIRACGWNYSISGKFKLA